MRAGRLISVMLILQRRRRVTAAELAAALEVSERTVLRDIEALSGAGVPVYATRGAGGGFQLMEGYTPEISAPKRPAASRSGARRARVRISPDGRRLAAVLGRLQPLRVRRGSPLVDGDWLDASFRLDSIDAAAAEVLSIGPHVVVLEPLELRDLVAGLARRTSDLYRHIE